MTIDREELAAIKKRNEVTYRFKQNLTEAEADRSALLDALEAAEARKERLREALNYYLEHHCEAYSDCGAADITHGDCHGCVAKRALAETAP